jgi:hypothetical protein
MGISKNLLEINFHSPMFRVKGTRNIGLWRLMRDVVWRAFQVLRIWRVKLAKLAKLGFQFAKVGCTL